MNISPSTTVSYVLPQAFLIAFTSDFLPRLLYQYKFDNELSGYVNFTLAYAPLNYTEYPMCRYTESGGHVVKTIYICLI